MTVAGLQGAAHHNGKGATVASFDGETGRRTSSAAALPPLPLPAPSPPQLAARRAHAVPRPPLTLASFSRLASLGSAWCWREESRSRSSPPTSSPSPRRPPPPSRPPSPRLPRSAPASARGPPTARRSASPTYAPARRGGAGPSCPATASPAPWPPAARPKPVEFSGLFAGGAEGRGFSDFREDDWCEGISQP